MPRALLTPALPARPVPGADRPVAPADPAPARTVSSEQGASRVDAFLVCSGLARSRGHARELITSGAVTINGRVVQRAAAPVPAAATVTARSDAWVGRAAYKLLAALDVFGAGTGGTRALGSLAGRRALDLGASTGGFTQVLLSRGVASVVALDVGHGQLAGPVARDPRVTECSGMNVRDVTPGQFGEPFDLVVADLSFISLRLVVPVIAAQLDAAGDAIVLVKPQFEVGRERLGKAGVVRRADHRRAALAGVLTAGADAGLAPAGLALSPLPGATGNIEYLVWWRHADTPAAPGAAQDSARRVLERFDEGQP